jgi:DNA-binding MarR family transcriptional regulator
MSSGQPDNPRADAMRAWLRFLRLNQRIARVAARVMRATGLSVPQFDLLSTLSEREGATQQDIAERLYVTKGNISGLIDRMADAGLVERRALPHDRRSHALFITAMGRAALARGDAIQREMIARTLGQLPEHEIRALYETLGHWRDKVRDLPQG